MKVTGEAMTGMQVIKMFAWEPAFMRRINALRSSEVVLLERLAKIFPIASCCFSCSPIFVSLLVFGAYVAMDPVGHVLTAEKVFVSISLFSILRLPLEIFSIVLFDCIRMAVSLRRIGSFLNAEELDENLVDGDTANSENAIEIENGSFSWEKEGGSCLTDVDLSVKRGALVAVVGRVGAGKTSLLSALIGDMYCQSGSVRVNGSVAYVPQQAWIQNATVKSNILFGSDENIAEYENVIEACGLRDDLNALPAADLTEIGENGVNLSGGQKQRVSLARAVYSQRDIDRKSVV